MDVQRAAVLEVATNASGSSAVITETLMATAAAAADALLEQPSHTVNIQTRQ